MISMTEEMRWSMMMTEKLFQQDDLFVYTRPEHQVCPCSLLSLPGICLAPEDCSRESEEISLVISLHFMLGASNSGGL